MSSRLLPICVAVLTLLGAAGHVPADEWNAATASAEELDASFRAVMDLPSAGAPVISPDGRWIAYSVGTTDWEGNRFDSEIWLIDPAGESRQLTRTAEGSSGGQAFSPDGHWLAFTASRGDSSQVWRIRPDGGEAEPLTDHEGGVGRFAYSPDGHWLAFSATDPESDAAKARSKTYGGFAVEDGEHRMTHLWVQEAVPGAAPRRLTEGSFTVGSFDWSPDGSLIAFDHRPTPAVNDGIFSDISIVEVATGAVRALVATPAPESGPRFSPDGDSVAFGSSGDRNPYYGNTMLALVPAAGGDVRWLTTDFDEDVFAVDWNATGLWFGASERTARSLYRLDIANGSWAKVAIGPENLGGVSFADDGATLALSGYDRTTLSEIWRATIAAADEPQAPAARLTDLTSETDGWALGSREVISWNSQDGAEIEGVLYKPENFDASRRYPLLVIIHGGPTGTSRPQLISSYVYPVTQWLQKGAVVLQPNYRGSAGYGEAFRALNVRNLGVGDMWDVMSGVQSLIDAGIADPERLGAMGWSQGGYISAFLTTNTDRFKAISVGAGISNWMTYYVNTDIHEFTRQYLQATPWNDPDIYALTSPMTTITLARTPTLIQHGEFDARVPTPNAYELYQGLQDQGVNTELVIYKGFGHGITSPKERLAATWHNWIWFARYLWNEEWEMPLPEDAAGE